MMILIVVVSFSSIYLIQQQKNAEDITRKREPNVRTILQAEQSQPNPESNPSAASYEQVNDENNDSTPKEVPQTDQDISNFQNGLIEIKFHDIFLQFSPDSKIILPKVSGIIPAGQISAILGPSSW